MSRVSINEWYSRVNDAWEESGFAVIPTPEHEHAAKCVRKLYRWATGKTWTGEIVFVTGNRYSYIRGATVNYRRVYAICINVEQGWDGRRGIIHSLSHDFYRKANPYGKPHSGAHARFERAMIREVIKRGWLGEPPAKTLGQQLLALCPISLMEATHELGLRYRQTQGVALGLIRTGSARWFRKRLIRLEQPAP